MYNAIVTHFAGATNTRGSRIVATTGERGSRKRLAFPYDHAKCAVANHADAARALALRLGWNGYTLAGGALPDGHGYVFTRADDTITVF